MTAGHQLVEHRQLIRWLMRYTHHKYKACYQRKCGCGLEKAREQAAHLLGCPIAEFSHDEGTFGSDPTVDRSEALHGSPFTHSR